jgi:hypothetical protein
MSMRAYKECDTILSHVSKHMVGEIRATGAHKPRPSLQIAPESLITVRTHFSKNTIAT